MFKEILFLDNLSDDADFPPIITFNEEDDKDTSYPTHIPILALKNTVLYPGVVLPITIGRDKSIKAVKSAYNDEKIIAVLSQREVNNENPSDKDLYDVGAVARILKNDQDA